MEKGASRRFGHLLHAAVGVVTVGLLLALPGSASSAAFGTAAQPWVYVLPTLLTVPVGDFIDLTLFNYSATAQTYVTNPLLTGGSSNPNTVAGDGGLAVVGGECTSCGPEVVEVAVSSPEVVPSLLATVNTGSGATFPLFVGPGQFALAGPDGVADDVLGSLEGSAANLQGLAGSTSSQVSEIASSVGSGAGPSSTDAQFAALRGQVSALSGQVTKLTALVNRLEPKPKPKPKKKKKKR